MQLHLYPPKFPWPEDSEGTFLSLTQAATCLYRTWWRLRIVPYLVPHVNRKSVNSIFLSLWFDPIGIELESTISVENAPSTRSLIDPYMYAAFFFTPFAIKMIFTACLLHKSATFLQLFDTLICATDFVNLANQWYEVDTEIFSVLYIYVR